MASSTTYPRTNKGMAQSPADNRKMKPEYHVTVAAYTLLKTATDTLLVKLSRKERQANRAPAKTQTHTHTGGRKNYFKRSDKRKQFKGCTLL